MHSHGKELSSSERRGISAGLRRVRRNRPETIVCRSSEHGLSKVLMCVGTQDNAWTGRTEKVPLGPAHVPSRRPHLWPLHGDLGSHQLHSSAAVPVCAHTCQTRV